MLERLVQFHLDNRWLVFAGLLALLGAGVYALSNVAIEAFPDLTPNQVTIVTTAPSMAPDEVADLVTYPIEASVMGLPKAEGVRSISKLGLSMVTVSFDDSVNIYFARQIINERIQEAKTRLPPGLEPTLGPVATAFGEVYQYTVEGDKYSLMELKTIHEWMVKNHLRSVPGVNEVNTWGGETKQFQVVVDPVRLQSYGLTLGEVYRRIAANNENFGGGYIEHAFEQYTVRGLGRARGIQDIENIVMFSSDGSPVMVKDVAKVELGAMPRQGAVTRDGLGERVSGMVIMLKGENGKRVIERVKQKLSELRLPEGVSLRPFYDQSEVIDSTIATVSRNLLEGGLLVVVILLLFLGNIRAALIVAAVIPLSLLFGFIGMMAFGISANLMSLGAIDFGMMVDGSVVMMENAVRGLKRDAGDVRFNAMQRIRATSAEVARPIAFAVAIIIAVYLPIFTLEGLEGRMFRPMAITVCSALLGSLILALTVVPAVAGTLLKNGVKEHTEHRFDRVRRRYVALLRWAFSHRAAVLALAAIVLVVAFGSLGFIGTEFMPRLDEGSILLQTIKLPGISLSESIAGSGEVEKVLREFPEVTSVVSKIGRPDFATEAMGIYEADVHVILKPREQWTTAHTKEELIEAIDNKLKVITGVGINFTQPMAMRLDETVSGTKGDVALKIFGDDTDTLQRLAERALHILNRIPGAADTQMEVISGVAELRIRADRLALARYGLNVDDLRLVMDSAVGGSTISEFIEGQRRFDIVLRLPKSYSDSPEHFKRILLSAPGGERVALSDVATIELARGPEVVAREDGHRRIVVQANVRGRDMGGFVAEAQRKVATGLALPPGYSLAWGGQFENQRRAMYRLAIVVPASILIIFGLLFATFHSARHALLILLNVPFAMVGGIGALWLRGLNLNVSAVIGLLALFGVAVLNGIVLVSYINQLRQQGKPLMHAIYEGCSMRLRPVLMTALVASLGFVPMALSTSPGAEVQRPLATVVIGGLLSATLLTLVLLPILYPWFTGEPSEPTDEKG
ncbi:MAG: CusA/CzcA family heavy metal efflux RND transporter [Bryobacterales bacterium]|nr:CusA/CzcA family heavy metal efflux RND transporter [Bryobacterales bacterium]